MALDDMKDRMRERRNERKRKSPYARRGDTWFQLKNQTARDTLTTQDVHNTQNVEYGELGEVHSKTPIEIGAGLAGLLLFIFVYMLGGTLQFAYINFTSDTPSVVEMVEQYPEVPHYWDKFVPDEGADTCWFQTKEDGTPIEGAQCYSSADRVPQPDWHNEMLMQAQHDAGVPDDEIVDLKSETWGKVVIGWQYFLWTKFLVALVAALFLWGTLRVSLLRKLEGQNVFYETKDINQHTLDGRLQLPRETIAKYGIFPDVGAHSPVLPSSMISHAMLQNKGVNKIDVAKRYEADVLDEDGNVIYYKGEIVYDDDGEPVTKRVPMFDEAFGQALYDASGLPNDKKLRVFFDASTAPYNPGGEDREKHGKQDTIAQHINEEWTFPLYEPQRPAGIYVVDVAPVNTMVLAITRAGKGQTYIEPMIDMWSREARPNNMVINDPKGELLVKNMVRFSVRGFQVIQFNLINPLKTDIYNPLGLAAEEARAGNFQRCAEYVENIADVFFPLDGGDDPFWPSAANNAFKRAVYGLIDFYLNEERMLRKRAQRENMDPKVLANELDAMWGKVTLYNAYQFFVQLSSKKLPNPEVELQKKMQNQEFDMDSDEGCAAYEKAAEEAAEQAVLWEGNPDIDMLTLFFNATAKLPVNGMRTLVSNADASLRAMGGSDKTISSVYGIAITAMSFFTDPTISMLTSGTPSQNTDLAGLSFPRRIGIRFHHDFVRSEGLVGKQAVWSAYSDAKFKHDLGSMFEHRDIIQRDGWARYMFEGVFETESAYLKLEIVDPTLGMLIRTFYFKFTKSWKTNLSGRSYVRHPVTGEKTVLNGVLMELVKRKSRKTGEVRYVRGQSEFSSKKLNIVDLSEEEIIDLEPSEVRPIESRTPIIMSNDVYYSEAPRAVFLVTPPHLMKYAKLILILIVQLVRLNFSQSYTTKDSQKPLYKTRFMLDELGNLQSDGNGIADFQTMLSIGLGQEQQFTLILQTLQQLRDVYGDSVDRVIQGNAQPLYSKILTPTGWIRMRDIAVGDAVVVPTGEISQVTGVFPKGERDVYRVRRASGAYADACDQHLWKVIVED